MEGEKVSQHRFESFQIWQFEKLTENGLTASGSANGLLSKSDIFILLLDSNLRDYFLAHDLFQVIEMNMNVVFCCEVSTKYGRISTSYLVAHAPWRTVTWENSASSAKFIIIVWSFNNPGTEKKKKKIFSVFRPVYFNIYGWYGVCSFE